MAHRKTSINPARVRSDPNQTDDPPALRVVRRARTGAAPGVQSRCGPAGGESRPGRWPTASLSVAAPFPVDALALGVDRGNALCIGRENLARISACNGDLANTDSYRRFQFAAEAALREFGDGSFAVGHDRNGHLLSTLWATRAFEAADRIVAVQHHHAHAVSCALDAGVALPAIAVVCDEGGSGLDGTIWGGEVLYFDATNFTRLAHLEPFPLPGGLSSVEPWRSALGVLYAAMPDDWSWVSVPALARIDARERREATRQLEARGETALTSSLGLLCDAVRVLLELGQDEKSAGRGVEALGTAAGWAGVPPYGPSLEGLARALSGELAAVRMNWRPMIREIVAGMARGVNPAELGARFCATIVVMLAEAVEWGVRTTGVNRVVLSGGCFATDRLRMGLAEALRSRGIEAKVHDRLPTGDSGVALGQAYVASCTVDRARRG